MHDDLRKALTNGEIGLLSLLLLVLVTGRTLAQPGEMSMASCRGRHRPVLYSELAGRLESGAATAGS